MGLQTLYPTPDYLNFKSQRQVEPLVYPTLLEQFPPIFLKMEFFDRKPSEIKKGPVSIIYLPLPSSQGFLMQDVRTQYNQATQDIDVYGEFAIRNYTSIRSGLEKVINNNFSLDTVTEEGKRIIGETLGQDALYGLAKTMLERRVMDSESTFARALKQGFGYGFAPNKILTFLNMYINSRSINFNFTPKSYEDAVMIEKILKMISRASLPKLKKEAFEQFAGYLVSMIPYLSEVGEYLFEEPRQNNSYTSGRFQGPSGGNQFDNIINSINNYTKGTGDFESVSSQLSSTFQNSDVVTLLNQFKDFVGNSDVVTHFFTENEQFFSSTFELPYFLRLAVMKKSDFGANVSSAEEAIELIRFPLAYGISQLNIERDQNLDNIDGIPFLKYEKDGKKEYFSSNYFIDLYLLEERIITSEDVVDHSDPDSIKEKNNFQFR